MKQYHTGILVQGTFDHGFFGHSNVLQGRKIYSQSLAEVSSTELSWCEQFCQCSQHEGTLSMSLSPPSLSSLASHTQTHFKFWYFDAYRIIRSSVEGHILYLKSRSKRWLAQATSGRSERFPRVLRIISGSVTSWLDYLYTIWPFVT